MSTSLSKLVALSPEPDSTGEVDDPRGVRMDNVSHSTTRQHTSRPGRQPMPATPPDPSLVLSSRLLEPLWVEAQARAAQLPPGQGAWWRWQAAARALTVALSETEHLAGTIDPHLGRRDWSQRPAPRRIRSAHQASR